MAIKWPDNHPYDPYYDQMPSGRCGDLWKKVYRWDLGWQKSRSATFLRALEGMRGFPLLHMEGPDYLILDWCGYGIEVAVRWGMVSPRTVGRQVLRLVDVMGGCHIRHRDITIHNTLWHPERGVVLIDFGWSVWSWEKDTPHPVPEVMRAGMCGLSDRGQVTRLVRELEYERK